MKSQADLFNEWKSKTAQLSALGGYIQNDFELLMKDGMTKEDLKNTKNELMLSSMRLTQGVDKLRQEIINFIEDVINKMETPKRPVMTEYDKAMERNWKKSETVCRICERPYTQENPRDRKDSYGYHWCRACTEEYDNIDHEKEFNKRNER